MRIIKYHLLSDIYILKGTPTRHQPLLLHGKGKIEFGKNVAFGVENSPNFYNGVGYIEARERNAHVRFGDNIWINNSVTVIAEKSKILIGSDCLIGNNVTIYDSDFHHISPNLRRGKSHCCNAVNIENNVFIGSNSIILKGVTIGENSIIGAGSVVFTNVPKNSIAYGNPAIVMGIIRDE